MAEGLLTIIVPTYNRSSNLEMLLRVLREETVSLSNEVRVIVSDNASTDETPAVIMQAAANWPRLITHRHPSNIGADLNFCYCVRSVRTKWFWIIGDDDMPKQGVIAKILRLLRNYKPALVYMQSEWVNLVSSADQGINIDKLSVAELNADLFAESLSTWLTFISGMVIDKERLDHSLDGYQIDRFNGTFLVQLGWILPLLNTCGPFLIIRNRCILATSGNTGGYRVLETFFVNFPKIIKEFFGSNSVVCKAVLRQHICNYLPGFVWQVRFGAIGEFQPEDSSSRMNEQLAGFPLYWSIIWPIMNLPKILAWPFYAASKVLLKYKRMITNLKLNFLD